MLSRKICTRINFKRFQVGAAVVSCLVTLPSAYAMGKKAAAKLEASEPVTGLNVWRNRHVTLSDRIAEVTLLVNEVSATRIINNFADRLRCKNAQEASGDTLANNTQATTGRFDWSIKCTRARAELASRDVSDELKKLVQMNPSKESDPKAFRRYTELLGQEPAYRWMAHFRAQELLLSEAKGGTVRDPDQTTRPIYPVWGVPSAAFSVVKSPVKIKDADGKEHIWRAPTTESASCDEIPNYKGSNGLLEFYQPIGLCDAGCFASGQRILTSKGWKNADEFVPHTDRGFQIVTLSEDATSDSAAFQLSPIEQVVRSIEAEEEELVRIVTEGGKQLVVTSNHPMVMASGVLRPAGQVVAGDALVAADGLHTSSDVVKSALHFKEVAKVTNFRMASSNLRENLVVSEGLLTGTSYYQNELRDQVNRGLARIEIPLELLSE